MTEGTVWTMNGELFPSDLANFGEKLPVPREAQERAHGMLRDGFRAGKRKQVLVLPTGGGKTVSALRVVKETIRKGKRAAFVCDRTSLINQTSARADSYGMDHGVIQAEHWRRNNEKPFQIVSVQTVQARGYWPPADVYVIDECHTVYAATKELLETTESAVIGLTATPCTPGLGKLYDNVVNAATMDELTQQGILVPMRIMTCVTPDMKGAAMSGSEWTAKAASERELTVVGDVPGEWLKHGENQKTIAFGADIAYCTELVQRFNAAGIGAAAYTSETDDNQRIELLKEFEKPDSRIKVLVSVEALAKGFDQPDVGCVIDARPLRKSISTAIQMWGRGLRSCPELGKTECILLDFSGNILRFHDDFTDIYFNGFGDLSTAEKMDQRPREDDAEFEPAGCPQCQRKPFRKRCLACGYEKPSQLMVEETPGEMTEIRIGKRVAAASKEELWNQLCSYAKGNLRSDKKSGWCWHKFQQITGEKPSRSWSFDSAPMVPVSPATLGKLKSLRIAYHRARSNAAA